MVLQVSDGEVTDSDGEEEAVGLRNTNAEEVVRAEREKREKDKEESQRKKEKDKEDRYKHFCFFLLFRIQPLIEFMVEHCK